MSDDFSDLLGLASDAPPPDALGDEGFLPDVVRGAAAATSATPPSRPVRKQADEDIIAYPAAIGGQGGGASASTSRPGGGADQEAAKLRRFVVRCEGRWRVRASPSLNSKVVGTVSSGTVVIGKEVPGEIANPDDPFSGLGAGGAKTYRLGGEEIATAVGTLWVEAVRFEANDPMGVSEIKRDVSSGQGGALYCLRRNALGYGLYEDGVESLEGPLLMLPEKLSAELRADAQQAAADKVEDVSLTWKLLGAAESMGSMFSSMWGSPVDEAGIQADINPQLRRRPEEVFEVRQREQLRKAAGALKKAGDKILAKAKANAGNTGSMEDVTAGLPKEVCRRFARLRRALAEAASLEPLVVSSSAASTSARGPAGVVVAAAAAAAAQSGGGPSLELPRSGSFCQQQSEGGDSPHQGARAGEGSIKDLEQFCELCGRLERPGGWAELTPALKQEVIAFSTKHVSELEGYAYRMGKAPPSGASAGGSVGEGIKGGISPSNKSPTSSGGAGGGATPSSAAAPAAATGADFGADFSLLGDIFSPSQSPPSGSPVGSGGASGSSKGAPGIAGAFLLPPPPPPKNGVQSLI